MAEAPTVTLITGPNRGIGHGILSSILTRPNNTVIAAVQDPQEELSQKLNDLHKAEGTSLHVVKIDSGVFTDPAAAVADLAGAGITHIDIVIANAAMGETVEPVLGVSPEAVSRHLDVNLIGVLALFQAVEPLLRKAPNKKPKFIALSSNLGSIALAPLSPGPWFCYGVTKAALNYMIRRVHVENDWLTAVALHPGWVQTAMGALAAKCIGVESAPTTVEESAEGCLRVIDDASREKYAGEFVSTDGETVPW